MGTIGIGDALTDSFTILKNNIPAAWPFAVYTIALTLIALVATPLLTSSFSPGPQGAGPVSLMQSAISVITLIVIPIFIISIFIQPLINGMYISGANSLVKGGTKPINLKNAFAEAKRRYLSLLGASILTNIIALAALAIPIALFIMGFAGILSATSAPTTGISYGLALVNSAKFILLGSVLIVVVGIVLFPFLFFVLPAVIIEKKGAFGAVRRSFQIGRKSFWRILGLLILVGLISVAVYIVASIIGAVFLLAGALTSAIAQAILHIITGIFISLFTLFASVMAYKAYLGTGKAPSTNK